MIDNEPTSSFIARHHRQKQEWVTYQIEESRAASHLIISSGH
jgi:hypothetical protein